MPGQRDDVITAVVLRKWFTETHHQLTEFRERLDAGNVFPVADHDTGTNLLRTVAAGLAAIDSAEAPAEAFARGAAAGACGNSGIVLASWFGGFASVPTVAGGIRAGHDNARAALADPVSGTIISVAHAAACAGLDDTSAIGQAERAEQAALRALIDTPGQLSALQAAGVVDSGGFGLLLVLRALVMALGGTPARLPAEILRECAAPLGAAEPVVEYEVRFHVAAAEAELTDLRARLLAVGDSVAIAGESTARHIHVHTADVGGALQAGIDLGRVWGINVAALPAASIARTLIACVEGAGLGALFTQVGARLMEPNPTQESLLSELRAVAGPVVLFPNDRGLAAAADNAAAEARRNGQRVAVVHTRSPVQALAALAVHDPASSFDDDVLAMAEAAAATRWAHVSIAAFDALTIAGRCRPHDALTIVEDEVVAICPQVADAAVQAVDRLLSAGGELVTIVVGAAAATELSGLLVAHLNARWPYVEHHLHLGGQANTALLIGVE